MSNSKISKNNKTTLDISPEDLAPALPATVLQLSPLQQKLHDCYNKLREHLIERDDEIKGLILAAISGTNILLLGPPGIAKSLLANSWKSLIKDANIFSWLLNKFSTPEELFGPLSLKGLEEDRYVRKTANKLPEAHIAFIDEIFKANSGILNSMLSAINEKIFYNEDKPTKLPLLTLIGASNEIPGEDDGLDALYDRLLLKYDTRPIVERANRIKMLGGSTEPQLEPILTLEDLQIMQAEVEKVQVSDDMLMTYCDIIDRLKQDGFGSTDRTYKQAVKILKAEAYFNGRSEVSEEDFDILQHVLWSNPDHKKKIYSKILDLTNPLKNEIVTLLDTATELYNSVTTYNEADAKKKKDAVTKTQMIMEANAKLREMKKSCVRYHKMLQKDSRDTQFLEQVDKKITGYLQDIYENHWSVEDFSA